MNKKAEFRIESDALGAVQIPAGAYWGLRTARVNLPVSSQKPHSRLLTALVWLKRQGVSARLDAGSLQPVEAKAIQQACDEIASGQWQDSFVVDPYQAGGGTAYDVNLSEMLCNRADEILGKAAGSDAPAAVGSRSLNLSQPGNSIFPSAARIALLSGWKELERVVLEFERLLRRKSLELEKVLKESGVQPSCGQEFNAYGAAIERCHHRISEASASFSEIDPRAIGIAPGASNGFAADAENPAHHTCIESLNKATGLKLKISGESFRFTQSLSDFQRFSSALKELALELTRIAGNLHDSCCPISNGSSGKTEQPPAENSEGGFKFLGELLKLVCYQVIANDSAIVLCAQSGEPDIPTVMPLVAHCLLQSLDLLCSTLSCFNSRCGLAIGSGSAAIEE